MNDNYLMHYGVLGMHWGKRKSSLGGVRSSNGMVRDRVGFTKSRQKAMLESDLAGLKDGSKKIRVGLTKKRQEQYTKGDVARIEKKLARMEDKPSTSKSKAVTSARVGASVVGGILVSNFALRATYTITQNPSAASAASIALGIIGGVQINKLLKS